MSKFQVGDWIYKPSFPHAVGEVVAVGKLAKWDGYKVKMPDGRHTFIFEQDAERCAE